MDTLTPTGTYRSWFPAVVRLPDGTQLTRAKVYATDAGLLAYTLDSLPHPYFQSPILLDKTPEPDLGYVAQQRGHQIVTEAGTVSVTKGGGCACGMQKLKSWAPAWAGVEKTWGA